MSDLLSTLTGDVPESTAETGNATAMSASVIDKRDAPDVNPWAPETVDTPSTGRPDPPLVPAAVAPPVPTIPAFGRIITANTITIPAGSTQPTRVGLHPSRMQQPSIAYMMLYATGGTFAVAGDDSAMPGGRATFPAGASISLDHVGGAYVWGDAAADVTVSILVVGV